MNIVNEKSSRQLKLSSFKREDGTVLHPQEITSFWYRLDEEKSGTNQIPQTSVTPADPMYLPISDTENVMVNTDLDREIVVLTYNYTYGAGKSQKREFKFLRKNLKFV